MRCNVCSQETSLLGSGLLLGKYEVSYYNCRSCGFVQTEEPYWLQESYTQPISRIDVGLVSRNIDMARITRPIISHLFNADAKFIDYGGGSGLFVRLMRDYGFDFYRYDKYCDNIFAQGFDADTKFTDMRYEMLTAFEVFEHLRDPITELEQMLKLSDNILFTTLLLPHKTPKPDAWWYYGLDHGQHISFYTLEALSVIAKTFYLHFITNGISIHLFTKNNISSLAFKLLLKAYNLTTFLKSLGGRKSLVPNDYKIVTGKDISRVIP